MKIINQVNYLEATMNIECVKLVRVHVQKIVVVMWPRDDLKLEVVERMMDALILFIIINNE